MGSSKNERRELRHVFSNFPTGVTIITTLDAGKNPIGLTISSFTSVSLDPPLILWCMTRDSNMLGEFEACTHFAVNILAADQADLSRRFAMPSDERFAAAPGRREHRKPLDDALAKYTRARDKTELFHALQAAGVVAGPLMNELEALASPQLEARDWFEEITREDLGTHRYPGMLFKLENTPNHVRRPPPKLGEHNEEIYLDLLGYSREQYDALVASGQVGTTYGPGVLPQRTEF